MKYFLLILPFLLIGCQGPIVEEKVKIVYTYESDSSWLTPYTTIEMEDGTRKIIPGVKGKVGDTFIYKYRKE